MPKGNEGATSSTCRRAVVAGGWYRALVEGSGTEAVVLLDVTAVIWKYVGQVTLDVTAVIWKYEGRATLDVTGLIWKYVGQLT